MEKLFKKIKIAEHESPPTQYALNKCVLYTSILTRRYISNNATEKQQPVSSFINFKLKSLIKKTEREREL